VLLAACAGGDAAARGASGEHGRDAERAGGRAVELTGAGATFPYPIYSRWIAAYGAQTGVRINYQSIGSGGGIRQLTAGTVDFGATDVPMTEEELRAVRRGRVVHVPMVLGAVAVTYNLPGVRAPLRLAPDVLADVFLGRITRWNDPRIASLNPRVRLPEAEVLVVHRADGGGTTYIFTDYLATVSGDWASGPGRGKNVRWPTGVGGRGNEGVAGQVKTTPGSIGYVETTYAVQNRLPVAALRNQAARFVLPSVESVTAAAAAMADRLPAGTDYRVSLVNAPGAASYPVASFSWVLVNPAQPGGARLEQVVAFVRWALGTGAATARALGYAPLPPAMAARLDRELAALLVERPPAVAAAS
jgi:phosphate transport system substrate-binding protein